MKQESVGFFELGPESVELVLMEGYDACFYAIPELGSCGRIKVGFYGGNWTQAFKALHHEAMEYAMVKNGVRYVAGPDYSNDNGGYLFVMDHTRFSECSARCAMFLEKALPRFADAFNKHKKGKDKW